MCIPCSKPCILGWTATQHRLASGHGRLRLHLFSMKKRKTSRPGIGQQVGGDLTQDGNPGRIDAFFYENEGGEWKRLGNGNYCFRRGLNGCTALPWCTREQHRRKLQNWLFSKSAYQSETNVRIFRILFVTNTKVTFRNTCIERILIFCHFCPGPVWLLSKSTYQSETNVGIFRIRNVFTNSVCLLLSMKVRLHQKKI